MGVSKVAWRWNVTVKVSLDCSSKVLSGGEKGHKGGLEGLVICPWQFRDRGRAESMREGIWGWPRYGQKDSRGVHP